MTPDLFDLPGTSRHPRAVAARPATALPSGPADSRNTAPHASSSGLWLALHLPQLPLETHTRAMAQSTASVVSMAEGGQARVLCADAAARQAGVYPGLILSAAHALVPELRVYRRNPDAERAALEHLAALAITYTSVVSVVPPLTVLLEIEGSLKLFSGAERLLRRLRAQVQRLGYTCALAVGPTALGAELLARAGRTIIARDLMALRSALHSLPVSVLTPAALSAHHCRFSRGGRTMPEGTSSMLHALRDIGVRSLGDLLRLPRAGLARRFGIGLVDALDRALGHRPDPRPRYEPPAQFESLLNFPEPVSAAEALLFCARRQLLELAAFLEARCAGARRVEWWLHHWRAAPTVIRIESAQVHRNARRFLELLRERLFRLSLPTAVESIELRAAELEAHEPDSVQLFPGAPRQQALTRSLLIERLRARLGNEAVHGFELHADHRPEHAFRRRSFTRSSSTEGSLSHPPPPQHERMGVRALSRPLWLLHTPAPLALKGTQPQWRGGLTIESGPERIESGWWDHRPAARDYYVARAQDGARLWVFRELAYRTPPEQGKPPQDPAPRWFLHGVFS